MYVQKHILAIIVLLGDFYIKLKIIVKLIKLTKKKIYKNPEQSEKYNSYNIMS